MHPSNELIKENDPTTEGTEHLNNASDSNTKDKICEESPISKTSSKLVVCCLLKLPTSI